MEAGLTVRERIAQELALLRRYYGGDVEYVEAGDWVLLPRYPVPPPCSPSPAPISFNLRPGYPGIEPYGFYARADLQFNRQRYNPASAQSNPPFDGQWIFFSWAPEGWVGTADAMTGSNLWGWARSFASRLREGP